jgi:FKBP-type peptidyl-prolyl cis-trans isomerase 2
VRAAPLAAALLLLAACRGASAPEAVVFHYEKKVDGAVRDSTFAEQPLRAELGKGQLLAGLEECLRQLKAGEERTFTLPPEKAYGPRDPAAVETMPLEDFGEMRAQVAPGAKIYGMRRGKPEKATVLKVEKGVVTLDFNPPDAGKTVVFRLRLVSRER